MSVKARRRARVLIVDDDPLVRNLLETVLQDSEFDIDVAGDGLEALKLAAENPPSIVLLDVMMPGLNGYEVCRAMRADPSLVGARIIIITARSGDGEREEAMAAGADEFFTKPFSPLDLLESLIKSRTGAG